MCPERDGELLENNENPSCGVIARPHGGRENAKPELVLDVMQPTSLNSS